MSRAEKSSAVTNDGHSVGMGGELDMALLLKEIQQMNEKFIIMEKTLDEVKSENKQLNDQTVAMSKEIDNLTSTVVTLETDAAKTNAQIEQMKQMEAQNMDESQEFTDGGKRYEMMKKRSISLSGEFPEHVTKTRKQLFPYIKTSFDNEKIAGLRYDSLVIDGEVYVYDDEIGKPVLYHK